MRGRVDLVGRNLFIHSMVSVMLIRAFSAASRRFTLLDSREISAVKRPITFEMK